MWLAFAGSDANDVSAPRAIKEIRPRSCQEPTKRDLSGSAVAVVLQGPRSGFAAPGAWLRVLGHNGPTTDPAKGTVSRCV